MDHLAASSFAVQAEIVHDETKVGDTLCTLPVLLALSREFGSPVHVTGSFAPQVWPLVTRLDLRRGVPNGLEPVLFHVDVRRAYQTGWQHDRHMASVMCHLADMPAPALPAALDLAEAPVAQPPGIVLSPFSGSDNPWYKAWPVVGWLTLVKHLAATFPLPLYVLGASGEDAAPFAAAGATPLLALPLPQVLHVLRRAELFVSIDNGLSHLAHFGGVDRHLLLYPELLPARLVANPAATVIRRRPEDITAGDVIEAAEALLGQPRAGQHAATAGLAA